MAQMERVRTSVLDIAFKQAGPADGYPVVLVHGFPYDPKAFEDVAGILNFEGIRTIVPYVRGFGGTRFLSSDTMRSGQQAAVGHDLLEMLNALSLTEVILAGFDWGARAACIVAALWPERVRGLVTCGGYQIQDIAASVKPLDPESERRWWYQYYFQTERGRAGLSVNRNAMCRLLWRLWSPSWSFKEATFQQTASSFENPDFVDVVVHSYRHRHGNAEGAPIYAATEERLATQPKINVPTIAVHGSADDVDPLWTSEDHERYFSGRYERRVFNNIGHNPPQESPAAFAKTVHDLFAY